ncbi:MAG: asparagine synthase (glutamine-hydrolyzing), partial [Alkalibacterium sp.]|nr:asparagine synthase (glutamine-hydrolyzing) [Alkalibacterium sp.]
MSEFYGYLLHQPKQLSKDEKQKGNDNLKRVEDQSPKRSNFYLDECICLSEQNLNEININKNTQPLSYENKRYWIIFDGVIYNDKDLRQQLKNQGYHFQTELDTEVILALYAEKREAVVQDLRGPFSFLIWDKEKKELFGARDSFGMKPFYFMENKDAFYFSSIVKNLYFWDEPKLNLEGLHYYFSYQYVPGPHTMNSDIRQLEPGYYFYKKPGQAIRKSPFAPLSFKPKETTLEKAADKIQSVLRESVHLQMESEHSVGAFLSGGVDSSAIVALAKEKNPKIPTFTVGFKRDGFSEINVAKKTADELDVTHHHYEINSQEFIEVLPDVIRAMGDPVADPAAIPLYIAAREAKKHVDIILSGEGADELFAGYNIYHEPQSLRIFDYIPGSLQTALQKIAAILPQGVRGKSFIERGTTPLRDRFIGNAKIFSELEKRKLLGQYQVKYHPTNISHPLYNKVAHYSAVQQMQYIDLHTWVRGDILVKADRMSKAHSLDLRSPFFDKKVFQVASELPSELTVTKKTTKYVLREALRGIVPDSVLYNRKLGFPVPIRHWLKDELADWAKKIIQESPTNDLINKEYVLDLLSRHQKNELDYSREIWTVLVFMIWYEENFLPAVELSKNNK